MYDANDPRSALNTAAAPARPVSAFGDAEYARFYAETPQEEGPEGRTWYNRGQNDRQARAMRRWRARLAAPGPPPRARGAWRPDRAMDRPRRSSRSAAARGAACRRRPASR